MSRYNKKARSEQSSIENHITRKTKVNLIPRNVNQEAYVEMLLDSATLIVFAAGPAGTGKTLLAVLAALKAFKTGDVSKIIVTRPAVGVDDEKHGFLPGSLNEKMEPWTKPIFDIIGEYYSPKEIQRLLEEGLIEISPLAYMRGRTFKNAFIIADEMQNATPSQMKMLLTRIGENSKMAVTGDIRQADRRDIDNGLLDFTKLLYRYGQSEFIEVIMFDRDDIERHPAVKEVLDIYGDED